jgi:hypothetical protein
MKNNDELEGWRRLWLSQPAAPVHLIRKVERDTMYMRLGRIAEILVTVFIGGGLTVLAFLKQNLEFILLATGTWLFILYAWRASLASSKGMWSAGAATVNAYIDLSIARCRQRIADIWTMSMLLLLQVLFGLIVGNSIVVGEGRWKLSTFIITLSISIAYTVALLGAGQAIKRWRLEPELDRLLHLRHALSDTTAGEEKMGT